MVIAASGIGSRIRRRGSSTPACMAVTRVRNDHGTQGEQYPKLHFTFGLAFATLLKQPLGRQTQRKGLAGVSALPRMPLETPVVQIVGVELPRRLQRRHVGNAEPLTVKH